MSDYSNSTLAEKFQVDFVLQILSVASQVQRQLLLCAICLNWKTLLPEADMAGAAKNEFKFLWMDFKKRDLV